MGNAFCEFCHWFVSDSDPITVIYYLAFIILTVIIVVYSAKTFNNQKKRPSKLRARVNYCFDQSSSGKIPVTLDIINDGDEIADNIEVDLYIKKVRYYEDSIHFIAPHEIFSYFVGYLSIGSLKMTWITGEESALEHIMDPGFFNVECGNGSGRWVIALHSDVPIEGFSNYNKDGE